MNNKPENAVHLVAAAYLVDELAVKGVDVRVEVLELHHALCGAEREREW